MPGIDTALNAINKTGVHLGQNNTHEQRPLEQLAAQQAQGNNRAEATRTPAGRLDGTYTDAIHHSGFGNETFRAGIRQVEAVAQAPVAAEDFIFNPPNRDAWRIDRAVIAMEMGDNSQTRDNLELAAGLLASAMARHPTAPEGGQADRHNLYSSALSGHIANPNGYKTPDKAQAEFEAEFAANGMSNKAIHLLGGWFVIGSEADKFAAKAEVSANVNRTTHDLMDNETPAGRSRNMFGLINDSVRNIPGHIAGIVTKFLPTALGGENPHGVVNLPNNETLEVPTTLFGASTTMMKIMRQCEFMGLDQEQAHSVALAVEQYWSDKHFDYTGNYDRHSRIEGEQGFWAYWQGNPQIANDLTPDQFVRLGQELYNNPVNGAVPTRYD